MGDAVIGALGTSDEAVAVATVAGQISAMGAFAVWSGDPEHASLLLPVAALRGGHFPRLAGSHVLSCARCGGMLEVARGVTENPDGSLTWRDEQGREHHVAPAFWLPE